jgi:hypothetical protein
MKAGERLARRSVVVALAEAGLSTASIFHRLKHNNYSRSFIHSVLKRFRTSNSVSDAPRSGRPRLVRSKQFVKVVRERFRRNPSSSVRCLAKKMKVSRSSLQRTVREDLGFKAFKKRKIPLVPATAPKTRVTRCKALLARHDLQDVTNVLFTDEKLFTIQVKYNPQNDRVYGARFEDIPDNHKFVRNKLHPQQVMVWAGISCEGRTELHFVEKGVKVTAKNYQANVLRPVVKPLNDTLFEGKSWVFVQDSAPAHKAKTTQAWLSRHVPAFVTSQEWPPYSPDLNPMDYYAWGRLEAVTNNREYKSLEALKASVIKEWAALDQNELCRACLSWRKRLTRCVKNKGQNVEKYV